MQSRHCAVILGFGGKDVEPFCSLVAFDPSKKNSLEVAASLKRRERPSFMQALHWASTGV
jgi:hypothetical protein